MLRRLRLPLRLVVPAGLVALVALLATLQYRWVGQVSEAERAQKQKSLHERAESFAEDFDRELSRLYSSFQSDGPALAAGDGETYARHLESWRERARFPEMLRTLYLIDADAPDSIKEYRPSEKAFVAVAWPAELTDVRKTLSPAPSDPQPQFRPSSEAPRRATFVSDSMLSSVPALRISLPSPVTTVPMSGTLGTGSVMSFGVSRRFLIAHLNREALQSSVLPALAAQYFPDRDSDSYRFAVIDAKSPGTPVYARNVEAGATLDPSHADASVALFAVRLDLVTFRSVSSPAAGGRARGGGSGARGTFDVAPAGTLQGLKIDSFASTMTVPSPPHVATSGNSIQMLIQSRGTQPNDVLTVTPHALTGWQLVLQHSAGSLDAAVSQVRRRNLWLSFGILAVLMVSVGFVLVSAQRAERLAGQQMDFVATVSHELRTPLAVIRSAAQNMSAGVVHDAGQAKRYGDLIETEGRRLTDMVEQVLEYAGLGGNRRPVRTAVDVGSLLRDVASSCEDLFASERLEVTFEIPDDLPGTLGEEDALRRALHNLVTNAVKYGADGRTIRLAVTRAPVRGRDELHASVTDNGRGIDPDDVSHIFEPFYRGRYAIDRQIRGNGLGLSLVKRIAEAHGGRVTVTSAPGEGATFTLHLPVATTAPAARSVATLASSEAMPQK